MKAHEAAHGQLKARDSIDKDSEQGPLTEGFIGTGNFPLVELESCVCRAVGECPTEA
jgi:hypothetical protein